MNRNALSIKINSDFIRNLPLLSGLPESEKDSLLREGNIYFYRRNQYLFNYGDPIKRFHVVCSGTVRLYRETSDGREITTSIRIPGDTICETIIFTPNDNHNTHAEIVHDAAIMEFPMQWLVNAAIKYPEVSINLLSAISQRTRKMKVETENMIAMSPVQRTACYLKQTCVSHGLDPNGFKLPYSKALVASRLGVRMETLSRTLPKLKEIGITVKDKHVVLHDLELIEQNLCSQCSGAESCVARKALMNKNKQTLLAA